MEEKTSKIPNYTQAGTIADSSLSGLRDQIKKIMIPMLIKIFQLKLELSQSISLPSRLQSTSLDSPDTTLTELKKLDEDLKLLVLWCQSCRNQISKAMSIPEEEQKEPLTTTSSETEHNPMVSKSFSEAMTSHSTRYQVGANAPSDEEPSGESSSTSSKTSWLKKMFQRP